MPVYTYKCQNCNTVFSLKEALFEKPLVHCPSCSNGLVRRIPQQPAVFFDNSGRYVSHRHIPHGESTLIKRVHKQGSHSLNEESKR